MGRVVAILGGVLVLALVAAGLTEATLAMGHRGHISDDARLRPVATALPTTVPSPSPSAAATPTPTSTPTPTATPAAAPTATTNSFVHLRAGKSTATPILVDLDGGTVVTLLPDSNAQWQQVNYNGVVGYIFKSYLAY